MAAVAFRIAATLGVVLCLHNAASAGLVMKFYLDGGDVWMSLSGTGQVPTGVGAPGDDLDFFDFDGDPFPGIAGTQNFTLTGDLTVTGSFGTSNITNLTLINQGTGASDLILDGSTNIGIGDTYTFSGTALVNGLSLGQLNIGSYAALANVAGNNDNDAFADVSMVITPEPASLAMMGVGVLGLCATRLRRRRQPVPVPDAPTTLG